MDETIMVWDRDEQPKENNMTHTGRCEICGNTMRTVHHENRKHWCWECEPYRAGSVILKDPKNIELIMKKASSEFIKASIFIIAGYAWAAIAYGVFPIR